MVRLVINADDFGESEAINLGIHKAFKEGVLSSCSIMASGDAFESASSLALQHRFPVGIHFVTAMGPPVLPPSMIPHLVDSSGRFPVNPAIAGARYFFLTDARRELAWELRAQLEKVLSAGLSPTHIDSHLHMHVNPAVFEIAVQLGEEYGIRRMRVPHDDYALAVEFCGRQPGETLMDAIFRILTARMKKRLIARGFTFPHRVYGLFMTGKMTQQYTLSVLNHLAGDCCELYFHPALISCNGGGSPAESGRHRELQILINPAIRSCLDELGIRPVSYAELD